MNRAARRAAGRRSWAKHHHSGGSCPVCGMSYQTFEGRQRSLYAGYCPDCRGLLAAVDVVEEGTDFAVEASCTRCDRRHMFGGSIGVYGVSVTPWWRE